MKLSKKFDRALVLTTTFCLVAFFSFMLISNHKATFAEGDEIVFKDNYEKFVTFFDDGEKLTVKTSAQTVEEALERAGKNLLEGDKVEPSLDSAIDIDNFYINIYRARPVIVRDGTFEKYLMTANYDVKTIFRDAGLIVYDDDEVKQVLNTSFLEAGAVEIYEVIRNGGRIVTTEEEIPFSEEKNKDYNMAPGTSEVRQLGEVGTKKLTYEVFYADNKEVSRILVSEEVVREPVTRIVAVGASAIERKPLTARMGRNRYTVTLSDGRVIERQETYYDLPMSGVMGFCGGGNYYVREDGAKVDAEGYILVAADLSRYPRCSIVETSLGLGKVYDTGTFVFTNPEQFDLATDWTNRDGR